MVRYDRALSDECLEFLKMKLGFLFTGQVAAGHRNYDIQIREKDQCTIYYGTTKVLDISCIKKRKQCRLSAEETYENQTCFIELKNNFKASESNPQKLETEIKEYLEKVEVRNSFALEGGIQDRAMLRYGRNSVADDENILIDREVVLGFTSTPERDEFYDAVEKTHKIMRDLFRFKGKGRSPREMDAIGINRKTGGLCLIEIKHSQSQSSELIGSPWQLLFYILAWKKAVTEDREGIMKGANALISCKQSLGLLPAEVPHLCQGDIAISPYLLIDRKIKNDAVWDSLLASVQAVNGHLKKDNIKPILIINEEFQPIA